MGQRRLARESGFDPKTVERAMPRLLDDGVLELVEASHGRIPACYRIAPAWVEGSGGVSGVVEGQGGVGHYVEGEGAGITGEVIHSPGASADTESAQGYSGNGLVPTSEAASADFASILDRLVPTFGDDGAPSQSLLPAETAHKVLEQGSSTSREVHVLGGGSTADAVAAEAYEPPPVSEAQKAWLRSRGLGPKGPPKSKSGQEQEQA